MSVFLTKKICDNINKIKIYSSFEKPNQTNIEWTRLQCGGRATGIRPGHFKITFGVQEPKFSW